MGLLLLLMQEILPMTFCQLSKCSVLPPYPESVMQRDKVNRSYFTGMFYISLHINYLLRKSCIEESRSKSRVKQTIRENNKQM